MLSPLDYVLLHLGRPGRYQVFVAFLIICLQLPISFSNNLWKYYTEEPPHRCLIRQEFLNGTSANEWIPSTAENSMKRFASCDMYIDVHNQWKGTQKCVHGWEYRPPDGEFNIVTEWDLVCDNKVLLDVLFYASNAAAISGCIIFGLLSDHFERKRSLLIALYLFISAAFSLHFVQDYLSFAVCFSLQTLFINGVLVTSFVLLMELFPTPFQLQASICLIAFGMASTVILPLLMWIIKSWRYVQLAVSAPGVVFLAHVWLLPQSPLWLTFEGKMLSAENLIENLARANGKTSFPPSFRLHLRNLYNTVKACTSSYVTRHRLLSKFSSPCLRWYFLVHFYLFFVMGLSSDVTESHVMRLNENKYADHFYRGLIDLGVVIIVYYFATRLGPRSVQSVLFIFAGLLMMGSITLHETLPNAEETETSPPGFDYRLLLVPSTLVSAAKALLKSLPALVWYHAVKTLPTGIRTVAFACCYSWTLVGHMAAPNLLILADLIAPFIPLGLCGSLSVVAGGLSLLFPSCWRKPLPNTVEEAENKALVPIKDRYPSFRDLSRSGKLASLTAASPAPSNVYSVPPTFPKEGADHRSPVTRSYTLDHHHHSHHNQIDSPIDPYFEGHYEVADPDVEIDEFENGNWQLYAESELGNQTFNHQPNPSNQSHHKRHHQQVSRDGHVFKSASRDYLRHPVGDLRQLTTTEHHVAETNL